MTAYKVVVADRRDLLVVTIICKKCATSTSLDVAASERRLPIACPSCEEPLEDNITVALKSLAEFHRRAALAEKPKENGDPTKTVFLFEIRTPEA